MHIDLFFYFLRTFFGGFLRVCVGGGGWLVGEGRKGSGKPNTD